MKKEFWKLFLVATSMGLLGSCAQDELPGSSQSPIAMTERANVEFKFDLGAITRADDTPVCADIDSLTAGDYKAYIEIGLNDNATTYSDTVGIIQLTNGNVVTEQVMITLPEAGKQHTLNKIQIYTAADDSLVYSGVTSASEYATHVSPSQLLPMDLTLASAEKITIDASVLCATNLTSEDFGFFNNQIIVKEITCYKYTVNIAMDMSDPCGTADMVANSYLFIQKMGCGSTGYDTIAVSSSAAGMLGDFCYNTQQDCDDEKFKITLKAADGDSDTITLSKKMTLMELETFITEFQEIPVGDTTGVGPIHFNIFEGLCASGSTYDDVVVGDSIFIMTGDSTSTNYNLGKFVIEGTSPAVAP